MTEVFYLRANTDQTPPSILVEKSSSLQGFGTLAEAVNALSVPTFSVNDNLILFRRAMNQVAISSRRGFANTLYSPKFMITPDNVFVNTSPKFKRVILCYQGTTEIDRTILEHEGTYYIHPYADQMALELIV